MEKIIKPKSTKAVVQYLAKYAENESTQLEPLDNTYDYVIVVPICDEEYDCLQTIFSNIKENVLIIVVTNSPIGKTNRQENNTLFIKQLINISKRDYKLSSGCQLLQFNQFNDVLLVDRNTQGKQIHADYGVGLARKIGCDIALKYYTLGFIKSPWIYSTDADVLLPNNYFTQSIKSNKGYSAIVLDFEHVSDDAKLNKLQFYYDFKLRYYQAGITYAGMAYNYIPLGSTLIVNMECYAQVRGFPKRNAGEDFYLLNKLAKIKPIKYLVEGLVVKIQSRFSDRVPFGTGPALSQISKLANVNEYKYYHPSCFIQLKHWYLYLNNLWLDKHLNIIPPLDKNLHDLYEHLSCEVVFKKSQSQITTANRWQQFIHQWFDAFKVLKTVHFFDKKYARLNYLELFKTNSFDKVLNSQLLKFIKQNDQN